MNTAVRVFYVVEVAQWDPAGELGVSRVKAHKFVRVREQRYVVTTQRHGRTKIVRLR